MTQAKCVHSTPPTNASALPVDPTRRRFLAQASVAAAGGAALGMTLPLPVSAGGPEQTSDPIFKAIEECAAKKKISDDRYAQVSRAYRKAKEAGLGDDSSLTSRNAFVEAELGCHPDDYTDETASDWWDSIDELFETEPTTLAGVLALLRHAADLCDTDRTLVEENAVSLIGTLTAAIEQIEVGA